MLTEQAQQIKLQYMTIDEVRAAASLDPLPNGEGEMLKPPTSGGGSAAPAPQPPVQAKPSAEEVANQIMKPNDQANPASIHPSLPALLRDLIKRVVKGDLTREDALKQGAEVIDQYTRLEEQTALIFVRQRTGNKTAIDLSPEMQQDLNDQRDRFLKTFADLVDGAVKLKEKKQP